MTTTPELLETLTFTRRDRDDFPVKARRCNDPACPGCRYLDHMRRLLGTLAEAAQEVARVDAAALEQWAACNDPGCHFEARQHEYLATAGSLIGAAFEEGMEAVRMYELLPPEWPGAEEAALAGAERALARLAVEAQNHEARRRPVAEEAGEPVDGPYPPEWRHEPEPEGEG